jgi:hypothetical protein
MNTSLPNPGCRPARERPQRPRRPGHGRWPAGWSPSSCGGLPLSHVTLATLAGGLLILAGVAAASTARHPQRTVTHAPRHFASTVRPRERDAGTHAAAGNRRCTHNTAVTDPLWSQTQLCPEGGKMEIPWTVTSQPRPPTDATIMASRFELTTAWRSPAFLVRSLRVWRQARRSRGALGMSLRAQPLRGTFWTLSAWTDRDALSRFARAEPHQTVMRTARPWMKDSVFRFWTIPAGDFSPAELWADAQARIAASDPPASAA